MKLLICWKLFQEYECLCREMCRNIVYVKVLNHIDMQGQCRGYISLMVVKYVTRCKIDDGLLISFSNICVQHYLF